MACRAAAAELSPGYTRLLSADLEASDAGPWANVLRGLRTRGLESSMDTWVVSTCALGLVETMKVYGSIPYGQDTKENEGKPKGSSLVETALRIFACLSLLLRDPSCPSW